MIAVGMAAWVLSAVVFCYRQIPDFTAPPTELPKHAALATPPPIPTSVINYNTATYHKMMSLEPNSLDVVLFGPSTSQSGYSPTVINNLIGDNFYNASTEAQRMNETNFLIHELYKRQNPKTIMISLTTAWLTTDIDYITINPDLYTNLYPDYFAPPQVPEPDPEPEIIEEPTRPACSLNPNVIAEYFPKLSNLQRIFDAEFKRQIDAAWADYRGQLAADWAAYDEYAKGVEEDWADYNRYKESVLDSLETFRDYENFRYHYSKRIESWGVWKPWINLWTEPALAEFFQTTPETNMAVLADMIALMKSKGTRVIFLSSPRRFDGLLSAPVGTRKSDSQAENYLCEQIAQNFDVEFYPLNLIRPEFFDVMGVTEDYDENGEIKEYWDCRDHSHFSIYGMNKYSAAFAAFYNDVIIGGAPQTDYLFNDLADLIAHIDENGFWISGGGA
jgi:hypothetical protein